MLFKLGVCRSSWAWVGLLSLAFAMLWPATIGCQLGYFLTDPEKEQEVQAEYGKIDERKVAVVVWADQATLDIYRRARYRVGKAVTYYMKKNLPDARFVHTEDVVRLQEDRGAGWEGMSAKQMREALDCDLVLRVDLLEYTTRASGTRELRKGRIRATVNLYECGDNASEDAVYETVVLATYPPASIHGVSDMDESQILHETVELFAQAVARKFYDHGVSMRGPQGL